MLLRVIQPKQALFMAKNMKATKPKSESANAIAANKPKTKRAPRLVFCDPFTGEEVSYERMCEREIERILEKDED